MDSNTDPQLMETVAGLRRMVERLGTLTREATVTDAPEAQAVERATDLLRITTDLLGTLTDPDLRQRLTVELERADRILARDLDIAQAEAAAEDLPGEDDTLDWPV